MSERAVRLAAPRARERLASPRRAIYIVAGISASSISAQGFVNSTPI
jgi:hypothetical protein